MDTHEKRIIMEQSRHLFLYGYNGIERQNFLKSLEKDYPIKLDSSSPIAVYLDDCSLNLKTIDSTLDKNIIYASAREYLGFSIASNILRVMEEQNVISKLNIRQDDFLKYVNRLLISDKN